MFNINIGDIVITKKKHPCGSDRWECVRIGADIKLKCLKCGHVIMLEREACMKRIKKLIKVENHDNGQET